MTTTEPSPAEAPAPDPNAVSVTLNGTPITARRGELIIAAAERHGEYIPRFCYHERMNPVGMCRMCLVEVDSGRGPAITPSCMVTVTPDMKIDTQSPTVKRMQEGVLELLLANHPLDCPVCDKGGECPLQDQTLAYGPGESRFVEEKRHYESRSPATTAATRCRSARWARSPRSRTASRPARGISTRPKAPAPRVRWGAVWWCNRAATNWCVTRVSTATR